ncbi:MAG: Fis family transcriptional regulator [Oceanicoccus sp.]
MAKPQSKTEKKIDNNIRLALTDACELFLDDISGFQWLTHHANYSNFPASLAITCVFDTDESRTQANQNGNLAKMQNIIQTRLLKTGVKLKAAKQQIVFECEETPQ